MKFFLLYVAYAIGAVVLEGTWCARIPTEMVHLDLVMAAVVALAFTEEWRRAVPNLIVLGALVDAASFVPFGTSIFSYLVTYAVMRVIIAKVAFQVGFGRFFWIAVLSVVEKFVAGGLVLLWTGNGTFFQFWLQHAVVQSLLDALVGFLLVPLLIWYGGLTWEKLTRPRGLVMKP